MGAKKRWERNNKAIEEGKQANLNGKDQDECPYKISEWGLGHWWLMGWHEIEQKALEAGDNAPQA